MSSVLWVSPVQTMDHSKTEYFFYLIISSPGRPIYKFKSVKEFLETCRDIIKTHKPLYQDGNILYRDISKNNFIITDAKDEREPKEMQINLNLEGIWNVAKEVSRSLIE